MAVDLKPLLQYLDFTKAAAELVIELINFCNGTDLTTQMVKLGSPSPVNGSPNTVITASSTSTSYYEGDVTVTYNRIQLRDVFEGKSPYLVADGVATMISDLIPLINSTYKLNLTKDDYIDGPLPDPRQANSTEGVAFILKANPKSLIFIGDASLRVTNSRTTPTLEQNVIMRTYLFEDAMPLRIKHNLNTVDFIESIHGVDNRRIYANVEIIDEMEFMVEFTEPESGRITVAFSVNV